ncbi:MAG: aspartate kinase [Coriobacteriales bacterium]|jgi:aspartate kinase
MALVVAKFGGSSVATAERIKNVAARLVRRHNAGDQVVAVVSAMGDNTDYLVDLAHSVNPNPPVREMDMLLSTGEQVSVAVLAMAIEALGVRAISHTGAQVGIHTDDTHTKAKISHISGDQIARDLAQDKVVVVAGFQGIDSRGEITTLGRGGSDTTAVALAAAIHADLCEIYSDVDGVYSADPRVCPKAHRLDSLSYEEMLELSANGAGVLQLRAVEFARNYGVVIHALSSFVEGPGTYIKEAEENMESDKMEGPVISGVAHDLSEAKITLRHVPDTKGVAALLFERMAELNVNVDMIIQDVSHDGMTDISFTAPLDDVERLTPACQQISDQIHAEGVEINTHVAKVSLVGAGMKSYPGVSAKMFRVLADVGVNISMISTSPIRISIVIDADQCQLAVRALHTAFGLDDASDSSDSVKVVR